MNDSNWNDRLKSAVRAEKVPPELEARIRSGILERPAPRPWAFWLAPAGISAAICASLLWVYHLGGLRFTAGEQESYIASVSARVSNLMRVGLGDHIHCAVFHRPQHPPAADQIQKDLGSQYAELVPIVRRFVPDQYKLRVAHQCGYHGRRFVHLSFANDAHLISLVIARKGESESFEAQGLLPALVQSGIPMYQSGVQRFAISAFETRDNLVYLISDLPGGDNTQMLIAMAPSVKSALEPAGWGH